MVIPGVPRQFTKNSHGNSRQTWEFHGDPFGDGKTVLRASAAELAYDKPNYETSQATFDNPPFATAISQTQTTTSGPLSFSSPAIRRRYND